MHIYEIILNEEIKRYDEKWSLYKFMGWKTATIERVRNLLIRGLTEFQLESFNKE